MSRFQESQGHFIEAVLSALDALVVAVAPDGRVELFSPACEELTGFTSEEVVGRSIWETLVPRDEADAVRIVFDELRQYRGPVRSRNTWLTRSGGRRLIEWSSTAVAAADGAVALVIATGSDVTERERRRHAMAAEEARLRAIVETCPDAIVTINERGIIVSFSAAAERLFGHREAEVLGSNVSVLMPEPYRSQHDGFLAHYLDTGERRIIGIGRLVSGLRKDGSTFPLELSVGEARTEDGRLFVGFLRDMTTRQYATKRVQELQAELERASRLAAADGLSSAIAHELTQPLTASATFLQACRKLIEQAGAPPARALDLLDKAAGQIRRAGEIVQGMRKLMVHQRVDRRPEEINPVVEEAVSLTLIGVEENGIRLSLKLSDGLPPVPIDRVQIQQVVVNLTRNAIEAMADCPRRDLIVTTERALPDGVAVSVHDTGSGIDEALRDRLFQPFTTSKTDGLGLGLVISRSIVESHGGRLTAAPNDGGGTVFTFTLPVAEEGLDDR